MTEIKEKTSAYLFEVSWEVCNKVGGIHTVLATKALSLEREFKSNHILIGPDVWRSKEPNPEFTEDNTLFKSWRGQLAQQGLNVKIGRWNVPGNPVALLVDFSPFIGEKNKILTTLWEKYRVDSLSGQWDYIEPVLFGYAAGKVIESFVRFDVPPRQQVIAQFHEWMTGSGLLYLRDKMPRVACVFTTHATVLGRCIAGNDLPLYDHMRQYNSDEVAHRFNVISKQSLESKAAMQADSFTTVSEITAIECEHFLGKKVDMITPNGFSNAIVPEGGSFPEKRQRGRELLLKAARILTGKAVPDDAFIVGISGRYEFRNKGIDVFIEALGRLNRDTENNRDILAFVLVPAGHKGANKELARRMQAKEISGEGLGSCLTHDLSDPKNDPILKAFDAQRLNNREGDRVKVVFCPCYLNGDDGIFNIPYYDLLIGMHLTVFPSYYEPWGYTPLESLAFKVPTITTSLAGFGVWVETHYAKGHPGIEVVKRNDGNKNDVVAAITSRMKEMAALRESDFNKVRENAGEIAKIALWDNLLSYYNDAYRKALQKASERMNDMKMEDYEPWMYIEQKEGVSEPNWSSMIIHRSIPENLRPLEEMANNLWWSWHEDAAELFRRVDPEQWEKVKGNPIELLDRISLVQYKELEENADFMDRMRAVYAKFTRYMEGKKSMSSPSVAYFSMEFGLHSSLKIYSGGLGILAGDFLKEASDRQTKITGVGLLYRYGYFTQKFSAVGNQEAEYDAQDFSKLPISPVRDENGTWLTVSLAFPGRNVYAHIWQVNVGRVELYLLDTDFEDNREEDRRITHYLYGGDWENRLKQELLLGCGGIQALRKMGIHADVYHCNEGHAAFTGVERLCEYVENEYLTFSEAMEVVRASSLFTTHTPVPAGHDMFSEDMIRKYLSYYPDRLKITWKQFMALGRSNSNNSNEKFSMSYLAANLSQETNGVSWLHAKVSRQIFKDLWPGYLPEELHISYVTNGVHYPTWTAPEWKAIESTVFGDRFSSSHYDKSCFEGIYKVPDLIIANVRKSLRERLICHVKKCLMQEKNTAYFSPKQLIQIQETLRDDILTIGFARRFATYKRAYLLFTNLDRLNSIVNNPEHPVQFIFAGKAHPADKAGQDLIQHIVEISKYPQFLGKILFLPNYDMDLARYMVQGVDVWMNTPTRPQEASGTSGEKAAMNGVMHFSVLDGWWVEGYKEGAGWALPMKQTYEDSKYQDELDAELIYNIIESEIVPAFYDRDAEGISKKWVAYIKNTIAQVASNFTSNRMLVDYENKFYVPMAKRSELLQADHYAQTTCLTDWKAKVTREWGNIQVVSMEIPNNQKEILSLGMPYKARVELDLGELSIDDIGVELVVTQKNNEQMELFGIHEFTPVSFKDGKALYTLEVVPEKTGVFMTDLRIFPKNPLLPHRQDFEYVKWI